MSWFSKLFGREPAEPIQAQREEAPDGTVRSTVSFTLDGDSMRPVRDEVVTAIDEALAKHDPDVQDMIDMSRMMRFDAGGPPVWSIATIAVDGPVPYRLWVTYGFSGLLTPVDYREAYHHEYSIAVACAPGELPEWPALLLRAMCRYVLQTRAELKVGDSMPCHRPITQVGSAEGVARPTTAQDTILVGVDPLIPSIETPHGPLEIRRFIGLYADEYDLLKTWNGKSFFEELRKVDAAAVSSLDRPSLLTHADFEQRARQRASEEGSSLGVLFVAGGWRAEGQSVVFEMPGGAEARTVAAVLRARLPFGLPLVVEGPPEYGPVVFEPSDEFVMAFDEPAFVIQGQLEHPAIQAVLTALESDQDRILIRFGG